MVMVLVRQGSTEIVWSWGVYKKTGDLWGQKHNASHVGYDWQRQCFLESKV